MLLSSIIGDYAKAAELYQSGLNILKSSGYWESGDVALEQIQMEVAEFFSVVGRCILFIFL